MENEKFNQAVDEIVGFIVRAQEAQMELLKHNIRAAYEANTNEIDLNAIAQQIMNLPVNSGLRPMEKIELSQPAIHLRNEMMSSAEKNVTIGEVGDLRDLSFVKVGSDTTLGKEFYHHCPQREYQLIRLHYYNETYVHECPVCGQKYEQK